MMPRENLRLVREPNDERPKNERTLLTLAFGFAETWRALGAKSAPYLRNE